MSLRLAPFVCVVATFGAVCPGIASAQPESDAPADFTPTFYPTMEVRRTDAPIRIDGELDDAGWRNVSRATGFAEVSPGDQTRPPVESEAWMTYDDENIYVALIAYDDPTTVRVSLRDRDNIFRDDYFGVMIDTYGDLAWGYELFVNPLGIQGDLRVHGDGGEDASFDIVWESRGRITDRGYQVEIAVPFSSLRFPERDEQTWRVNFWRDHQRDVRRRYAWAAQDRDDSCWMCQWGTVTGIRGVSPSKNLELIGTAVGFQAGEVVREISDPDSVFDNQDPDGRFALNVRYGLTSSSSAELTLNPDFSQVESDAGQLDANTTFALFFPERRPFFQEGSDLYGTWIDAIYTRSINDPDGAAKITGQFGSTSGLYLFGADDLSPVIIPSEERSSFNLAERSISNIARVRQSYGNSSTVGALFTDRRLTGDAGGAGTTVGIDGRHRFTRQLQLEWQVVASHTEEPDDTTFTEDFVGSLRDAAGDLDQDPEAAARFGNAGHTFAFDGESYWGRAAYVSLERGGRTWSSDIDYWEYSPEFRADNGFTTRNDYRQVSFWNGLTFQPNGKVLIDWSPGLSIGRVWDHDGGFEDEWLRPSVNVSLTQQTSLFLQYLASKERFRGLDFPNISRFTVQADTRPTEFVTGGGQVVWGRTIWRTFSHRPLLGDGLDVSLWGSLKPFQRLVIEPNWDYSRLDDPAGDPTDAHPDRRGRIFEQWILRTRLNYQFTRSLFLRLVVQYGESDRFNREGRSKSLDIEPLLTYRVNPFTLFFIGSTSNQSFFNANRDTDDLITKSEWTLNERQFFAKVSYLFRL